MVFRSMNTDIFLLCNLLKNNNRICSLFFLYIFYNQFCFFFYCHRNIPFVL